MESFEEEEEIFLVLEYVNGCELGELIREKHPLSQELCWDIFYQLVETVSYCHAHGIIHRDLKPSNILLTSKQSSDQISEKFDIKLIDWGIARFYDEQKDGKLVDTCGTLSFQAPEVTKKNYDTRSQVWSLGIILYFMLTGLHPYEQFQDPELLFKAV